MPDAHSHSTSSHSLHHIPIPPQSRGVPHKVGSAVHHSEWCFVSMVLGVFGLVLPLFSALAIIVGIGGLMHVQREKVAGKWMALLGIGLGFLGIVLVLVAILFQVNILQDYLLRFGTIETLVGKAYRG